MRTNDLAQLRLLQDQWYGKLFDLGTLYATANGRKDRIKAEYAERYPDDKATQLEMLASSALYADAKDDIWQAAHEIPAVAAFLQALQLRIDLVKHGYLPSRES